MANQIGFFQRVFGDDSLSRADKMKAYGQNAAAIQAVDKAIEAEKNAAWLAKFEELKPRIREAIATWVAGKECGFPLPAYSELDGGSLAGIGFVSDFEDERFYVGVRVHGEQEELWADGNELYLKHRYQETPRLCTEKVPGDHLEDFCRLFDGFEEQFYRAVDTALESQDKAMETREKDAERLSLVGDVLANARERYEDMQQGSGRTKDEFGLY